ncbi:hypothetical protein VTP01DRAFT_1775 [Rhizomucor pusillus]|uniref:uncharacterized protein n=1 Tax=Rhizomucor pusillus TaxID=4840 RepID=UPI0037444056
MASHLESIFSGDLLHDLPRLAIFPPIVPFGGDSPFDTTFIQDTINHMPTKKAPGIDHLRSEMLKPIQHLLAPLLLELFRRCWRWSYTPHTWRIAQVVPIYKKASPTDAMQGGFRKLRGTLDQALCLAEICQLLRMNHKINPVLAFLDIKSAYDTANRNLIWASL